MDSLFGPLITGLILLFGSILMIAASDWRRDV